MSEKLYLLGHPIAHSQSPTMYNELYLHLGLDWEYGLKDCATDAEAEDFLEKADFLSINITTPYKTLALKKSSSCDPSARLAGGANVLIHNEAALQAYNFDGSGCVSFLKRGGFSYRGASVVVCGTGPTALAIVHASACAGARKLVLLGRNRKRVESVLRGYLANANSILSEIDSLPEVCSHDSLTKTAKGSAEAQISSESLDCKATLAHADFTCGTYLDDSEAIREADLVIDATPVGMLEGEQALFDLSLLHEGQTVLDVVYCHGQTSLVRGARAQGCTAYDGHGMLVSQAVETAAALLKAEGIKTDMSDEEMFALMAKASHYEC